MNPIYLTATDLNDAWFQAIFNIIEKGRIYTIDRGSFQGQQRLEFDHITIHIKYPSMRPLLPQIPSHYNIPNPVEDDYLNSYMDYVMGSTPKADNEVYTYAEYIYPQMNKIIEMFRKYGHNTNQATMTIGDMDSVDLEDPPCLKLIQCRISYGKLHFVIYFRSNEIWAGMPANLAALQLLKEYMAAEIGVEDGEMIYSSLGLHLYDYCIPLAEIRTGLKLNHAQLH